MTEPNICSSCVRAIPCLTANFENHWLWHVKNLFRLSIGMEAIGLALSQELD